MSKPARRLPFGFMNRTRVEGRYVIKRYVGAAAKSRMENEHRALREAADIIPAPAVIEARSHPPELVLQKMPGTNMAQRLGEDPQSASALLAAAGRLLLTLQRPERQGQSDVRVHGDFGPQNLLVDEVGEITAVVDWEWSTIGSPVTDPAWLEWTILMHYAEHQHGIAAFYASYGETPAWTIRQDSMLECCRQRLHAARKNGHQLSVTNWEARTTATSALISPL